jgi:proteic killer suppression protein
MLAHDGRGVLGVVELWGEVHGHECTKPWIFELIQERPNGSVPLLKFNVSRYTIRGMIESFRCKDTHALFAGQTVTRFVNFRSVAERKLAILHRSVRLDDLRIPPNNRLEALKGNRSGQFSIRINDQWRICFRFENGHVLDVEIVDYH